MGSSWRADVDPDATTALVTEGPFGWVRNPVFTASTLTALGVALMVPNAVALGMLVATIASYQILVRLVEEPYLERVHGETYRAYAARTGRFVPWLGRGKRASTHTAGDTRR
jgi:protein-S-isoprenylcysteine O-methyltransferase Ste14